MIGLHRKDVPLFACYVSLDAFVSHADTRLYHTDLSVDLRDAVGDRLYLSDGFRRDGTLFDVGQATALKEHAEALSARQAISQSRKSRGFFSTLLRRSTSEYRPTYNYQPDGSACRVYGTIPVKKVTGSWPPSVLESIHATDFVLPQPTCTLQPLVTDMLVPSMLITDVCFTMAAILTLLMISLFTVMNLSHVITEFSFGPYFPEITQPLDNSFELTDQCTWLWIAICRNSILNCCC